MGRHIVGALGRMREAWVVLGYQPVESILEVSARGRVGVLLDRQAGRGMLDHHRAQTLSDPGFRDHVLDTIGELDQPLARGADLDLGYHCCHRVTAFAISSRMICRISARALSSSNSGGVRELSARKTVR